MEKITGIVLAGGKSSRFGSPKYNALINGFSLLEIAISKLKPVCSELIVLSKEPVTIGTKNVIEKSKNHHPLVGIKEGLSASKTDRNLVLACDTPFVSFEMINKLLKSKSEVCIYRYKGKIEPLLGLYEKSFADKINNFENKPIIEVLKNADCDYIDIDDKTLDFFNINTREDLVEAKEIVKNNPRLLGY